MKYVYKEHPERFVQFGERVFGIDKTGRSEDEICREAIGALEDFFHSIGLPTTLKEAGIGEENFECMAQKACQGGSLGSFKPLHKEDVVTIYKIALQ